MPPDTRITSEMPPAAPVGQGCLISTSSPAEMGRRKRRAGGERPAKWKRRKAGLTKWSKGLKVYHQNAKSGWGARFGCTTGARFCWSLEEFVHHLRHLKTADESRRRWDTPKSKLTEWGCTTSPKREVVGTGKAGVP